MIWFIGYMVSCIYMVFWYIGNGIAVGLAANRRGPIQKIGVPKFFGGYIFIHKLSTDLSTGKKGGKYMILNGNQKVIHR